ncbi:MAG TPA: PH domain-containing protein [Micromonosporaceae bacterium]
MERARFRYNVSICLAGILAFLGAIPVATVGFGHEDVPAYAYVLLLILLVPLSIAVWGWRAGTDADANGLRIRALISSRRIPWTDVALLGPRRRRVYAQLTDGRAIKLAAVSPADLPRLVAASGQKITEPVRDGAAPAGEAIAGPTGDATVDDTADDTVARPADDTTAAQADGATAAQADELTGSQARPAPVAADDQ